MTQLGSPYLSYLGFYDKTEHPEQLVFGCSRNKTEGRETKIQRLSMKVPTMCQLGRMKSFPLSLKEWMDETDPLLSAA